ncbi:MAG: hypothetical protein PHU42_02785 [Patescibacteria group bacterium]|nr:hypothetical protein [Patescibacteria group bacterium]
MRDNTWLANRLHSIWQGYFAEITDGNEIEVRFGRSSKTRLGSITIREKVKMSRRVEQRRLKTLSAEEVVSIITINGHLQNPEIPEEIVDGVLAHEFAHFVHGFNSMRERHHRFPHYGGIINNELKQRGLNNILKFQKKWLKDNWKNIVQN